MKKCNLTLIVIILMGFFAQSQDTRTEKFRPVNQNDINNRVEKVQNNDVTDKNADDKIGRKGRSFQGDWTNLGPVDVPSSAFDYFGNGGVMSMAFHPTDPDIIYIGTQAGGLWKTSNGGQGWSPLTDYLPTPGVPSVVINPNNPDVIYIGTLGYMSDTYDGLGVYKSIDGGESFLPSNTGIEFSRVRGIVMHRNNPDTLLAITNYGLYKTTNGGNVWNRYLIGYFDDIAAHPTDNNTFYTTQGGRLYKSTNIGDTWQELTEGLPLPTNSNKGRIGVSLSNPDYVYFLLKSVSYNFEGLYLSTDGGDNFGLQSDTPNIFGEDCDGGSGGIMFQSFSLTVDPNDEETVYAGKINCWKSQDAGVTWDMVANQTGDCDVDAVHAELNALEWDPHSNKLYSCNGGGVWFTSDYGLTWNSVTDGLAISQQYYVSQSKLIRDHLITSCVGNGISSFHSDSWIQADINAWFYNVKMDNVDTSLSYGCTNYGGLFRLVNDKAVELIAGYNINGVNESGWNSAICQHETAFDVMFLGMRGLWRTRYLYQADPFWEKIWTNPGNGGIRIIEQSPSDENLLYFSTGYENLYKSDNILSDDPHIEDIYSYLPDIEYIEDIETHPKNPEIVYVVGQNNIFKSNDKGYTWDNITANLTGRNILTITIYERNNSGGLYVGTKSGIYFKDDYMTEWVHFSENLPTSVEISDIDIYHNIENPLDDIIRAATNGRGLWSSSPYYYEPVADFSVSDTIINQGCSVDFYNMSQGYPSSWSWTFEGGTPNTSQDANPTGIVYNETGVFEVSLTVENPDGTDTKTVTGLVIVEQGISPSIDFSSDFTDQCSNKPIHFFEESEGCPESWKWTFTPDNVSYLEGTNENSLNPIVSFDVAGIYSVKLEASNAWGQSQIIKDDYMIIGGLALPFSEDFSGGSFKEMGWEVNNPDYSITWELKDVVTSQGVEGRVAWLNNFNYPNFAEGERDYLITPILNFSGFENVSMSFEYAYAERYSPSDSLYVGISTDCGVTWTNVYANGPDGQGVFATSEPTTDFFEPQSSDDWCVSGFGTRCPLINLNDWVGMENVKIRFESYSRYGNNLYLNNIIIDTDVSLYEENLDLKNFFELIPNPADKQVSILLNNKPGMSGIIEIMDIHGSNVLFHNTSSKTTTLDISSLESGIYFVRVSIGNNHETRKIIVL